jgi:protein gp37
MAKDSKIEWTHHTANLWHGCTKVNEGCDHCYAETLSRRWGNDIWGNDKPRKEIKSVWKDLERFQKEAAAACEVHRVFVGSMMDIFEKPMPLINAKGEFIPVVDTGFLRNRLFFFINRGDYPNLLFLFLTKRPSNINKYIPESWKETPPNNIMFGTSVVNQETANKLIPQLLTVKGKKFLSVEPLLGPVNLTQLIREESGYAYCDDCLTGFKAHGAGGWYGDKIDWVIVGGESGHGARPMNPDWARSLRDQCHQAGIPFLFKQWGNWKYAGGNSRKENIGAWEGEKRPTIGMDAGENDGVYVMVNVGKKAAGRVLDGQTYDQFPTTIN